ncbi:MAG TPA: hypothetical protein VH349_11185 [Ktedonobacterales bacterium]|jgi:hypothetical protein
MAQPSSTTPDEEMRSPLPKPRRFAWFFQPITLLLLCARCGVSIGVFVYVRSSLYPRTSSTLKYSFPHLQAPGLHALSAPELERNGYYLSVITTLPAAGPGRAARILLNAHRDHDQALYSIDTDGRNLQRLPETLPCDGGFMFTPDARELTCKQWFMVYPFDPVTLRVTGEMTLIDPVIDLAIWGPDSHQFVTSSIIGLDRGISLYQVDGSYTKLSRLAVMLFSSISSSVALVGWSPDGDYLSLSIWSNQDKTPNALKNGLYLLSFSTIRSRLTKPASSTWVPGVPVAQIQPSDLIQLHTSTYCADNGTWEPRSSALTVLCGDTYSARHRAFGRISVPDGSLSPFLQFPDWPSLDFSYIGYAVWAPDNRLVFHLTTYSCGDICPSINPGNDLYVYIPPNQT